ncbi:MAG: hypothetical protein PHW53_02260 [Patescibacteria group bacterium]|nr:hypothetical protein [Patescibacteria group bacterium]
MIAQIIIGIVIILVGAFMVIKTETFYGIFGPIAWADAKFGGTRFFYKVLGIVFCIIGFMVVTNMWQGIITWIFGSLLGKK